MSTDKVTTVTSELQVFSFCGEEVRGFVHENCQPCVIAVDIGRILGIKQIRSTLRDFPSWVLNVHIMHTQRYNQAGRSFICVNEPGIYRLIFQSRRPEAEIFQQWVYEEVLPTLRRTGTYTVQDASAPELFRELRTQLAERFPLDEQRQMSFHQFVEQYQLHPKYPRRMQRICGQWADYLHRPTGVIFNEKLHRAERTFSPDVLYEVLVQQLTHAQDELEMVGEE